MSDAPCDHDAPMFGCLGCVRRFRWGLHPGEELCTNCDQPTKDYVQVQPNGEPWCWPCLEETV